MRSGTLLVIWIAVIIVFFSLSRSKEDLYILPSSRRPRPWSAACSQSFIKERLSTRWQQVTAVDNALLAIVILTTGAAALYLFGQTPYYNLAGAKAIGVVALAGGFIALAALLLRKRLAAIAMTALAVVDDELDFRAKDAAGLRAIQARPPVLRVDRRPSRCRRDDRLLQVRLAEHGLLFAATHF